MTEDEATTKWCPFARVSNVDGSEAACNRWEDAEIALKENGVRPGSLCIGSACMAWRWSVFLNPEYKPAEYAIWPSRPAVGNQFVQSDTYGYCGLAGKP